MHGKIERKRAKKKKIYKKSTEDDYPSGVCNGLNMYCRFDKCNYENEQTITTDLHCNRNAPSPIITREDVIKSLRSIMPNKAAGQNGINCSLLTLCREPLSPLTCKSFKQSIDGVCKPVIWRTVAIVPVLKKSPPTCYNDYRPVS